MLKAVGLLEGCQGTPSAHGEECVKRMNGYYPVAISTVSIGVVWYLVMRKRIEWMRDLPAAAWRTGAGSGAALKSPKQLLGLVVMGALFLFGSVALG